MIRRVSKRTFWNVRPAKIHISLRICAVWSESSLSAWWHFASSAIQNAPSEHSDQTARMRRLIWIFVGCTCPKERFEPLRFVCYLTEHMKNEGPAHEFCFAQSDEKSSGDISPETRWAHCKMISDQGKNSSDWNTVQAMTKGTCMPGTSQMSQNVGKRTVAHVHQAKIQISLRIRAVWPESSLGAFRIAKAAQFLYADWKDAGRTARKCRLIWVFVGRTCQKVRFLALRFWWFLLFWHELRYSKQSSVVQIW